jgi:membrane-associated phospholipid phosphatase
MKSTDRHWYLDVNTFTRHTGWLHGFMKAYALWGGLVLLALMAILAWFWARRQGRLKGVVIAVLAGVSALISLGVNHFVSQAVARRRPCHVPTLHVHSLLACASDYSFPSDHAVIAGALAMGLLLFDVRWGILATLLALLLAFSRVYVGVHYPGDVVAGLLMGAAIAIVIFFVLRRPSLAVTNRLAQTPLRPLVAAGAPYRASATYRT